MNPTSYLKTDIVVDFKKSLEYPPNPSPLRICHGDGRKRLNKKSDQKDIHLKPVKNLSLEKLGSMPNTVVIVDMISS